MVLYIKKVFFNLYTCTLIFTINQNENAFHKKGGVLNCKNRYLLSLVLIIIIYHIVPSSSFIAC